jgi:hypothetical protein
VRVDLLVRLDLAVPEVEEGLPADEAPGRSEAARQVGRVAHVLAVGVEDHPEEGSAVVSLQVGSVGRPDHAVPEAVRRALELHRHRRLAPLGLVKAGTVAQNVVDHRLPDEQRQELVQDHPLVVPGGELPSRGEGVLRRLLLGSHVVDRVVVEQDERAVQPGDHQILVVARIRDDR